MEIVSHRPRGRGADGVGFNVLGMVSGCGGTEGYAIKVRTG